MNLKQLYISSLCMLFALGLFGQKSIILSGKLIDTLSTEPLSFATVSLQNSTTKDLIFGQIADDKGDFKFESVGKERFFIKIEHVGYKTKYVEVNLETVADKLDLGALQLAPLSQLSEYSNWRSTPQRILQPERTPALRPGCNLELPQKSLGRLFFGQLPEK